VVNNRSVSVTESQIIYLGAHVRYDPNSGYSVIAEKPRASYEMSFNSALPACWNTTNTTADCADDDRMESNTVIRMLGSDWLILDYTSNGNNITSLTLGKVLASAKGLLPGDVLWIGASSKATLTEFSMTGAVRGVPKLASFSVETPAEGVMAAQLAVGKHVNVSGITMRVNRVYLDNNSAPRADVTAMSAVLTLTRNLPIDAVVNSYWYADITSTMSGNSSAISKVRIYSTFPNPRPGDKLMANDSMTIIPGEPAFNLSYSGLNITADTYDMLSFNIQNSTMHYSEAGTWTGPFVEVVSGVPGAFPSPSNSSINGSMLRIPLAALSGSTGVVAAAGTPLIQNNYGYWTMLSSMPTYHYSSSETATISFNYSADQSMLCVADNAGDTRHICALIDPGQGDGGVFANADGSPIATMLSYNQTLYTAPAYAANFMTDRGSRILSVERTHVSIEYAKSQVRAVFTIRNVAQNATSGW